MKRSIGAIAFAALLAASACSGDGEPVASPTATATAPPAAPSPTPSPTPSAVAVAPLTGLETTDAQEAARWRQRPAMAVKIENTAAARPQTGLDVADVVFEELTEGGVTRFIAIVHSTPPETIGNVRSARMVDADVLPPFRPVLVVSGARPTVVQRLRSAGIATLYHGSTAGLSRVSWRSAPHNVYGDVATLYATSTATSLGPPEPVPWGFGDAPSGGVTVEGRADVRMSSVSLSSWEWDDDADVWRKYHNGAYHAVTGEGAIGAANVVVIEAERLGPGSELDAAGNPVTVTDVIGTGRAAVLRDGRRYEAVWTKNGPGDHFRFTRPDGTPLPLAPGRTWIHLAPPGAAGS